MSKQQTFSMIKPDAVHANHVGQILAKIESKGLKIKALKMFHMDKALGEQFYGVHSHRPFFQELVDFITSGPVVAAVLEGENAVAIYRELMGATDPAKASAGTIRAEFAKSIGENAVHGSDATDTALIEIALIFPEYKS
jgi:nucleoside-diphosphate kinase